MNRQFNINIFKINYFPFSALKIIIKKVGWNTHYYHVLEHLLSKKIKKTFNFQVCVEAFSNKEFVFLNILIFGPNSLIKDIIFSVLNYVCDELELLNELKIIREEYFYLFNKIIDTEIEYIDFCNFISSALGDLYIEQYINTNESSELNDFLSKLSESEKIKYNLKKNESIVKGYKQLFLSLNKF